MEMSDQLHAPAVWLTGESVGAHIGGQVGEGRFAGFGEDKDLRPC